MEGQMGSLAAERVEQIKQELKIIRWSIAHRRMYGTTAESTLEEIVDIVQVRLTDIIGDGHDNG